MVTENNVDVQLTPCTCENCGHTGMIGMAKFRIGHDIKMEPVTDKGPEYGYDTTELRKKYNISALVELEDFDILCPKCLSDKYYPKKKNSSTKEE